MSDETLGVSISRQVTVGLSQAPVPAAASWGEHSQMTAATRQSPQLCPF